MLECMETGRKTKSFGFKQDTSETTYIGQFALHEKEDKFEIWCLGIMGKYRQKGYATQMLKEFLAQFKHDKPLALYVFKTNEIAIHLYEKVGFQIVSECSFEPAAYEMQYIVCP